ncbi:MAG: DUF4124 domain-containing protein [Gammaproteobacteria bacterium]
MLASLAAFAGQAAVIYKWTDAEGVIHYSDQSVPGAQKIYTNSPVASSPSGQSNANQPPPVILGTAPQKSGYSILAISSPASEQTFFGDEPIGVALAIEPSLKSGDIVTWHLNGKQLDDQGASATQITLPHLDRGTYAIAATITDPQSGQSQSTSSVTFFVHQPSALSPQHRTP